MDPETSAPVYASTETTTDPARHTVTLTDLDDIKLWELRTSQSLHRARPSAQARTSSSTKTHAASASAKPPSPTTASRSTERSSSCAASIATRPSPSSARPCPRRVQRKDADILRTGLHCNIVRTSHYPQSRHFLDRCDEIGLLVLEEIPGWQHIGPEPWKQIRHRQRRPHDSPRLESSIHHPLGRPHQRVARRPRLLHPHQRPRARSRYHAPDRRHP